jgi:uncharacterized protein (DUF924 family)
VKNMLNLGPSWQGILDYWFQDGMELGWPSGKVARQWFAATADDDAEIEYHFGALVEAALHQELVDWERNPAGRLALIILLDQFTRNIYRGQAEAFSGDHRAATLAIEGLSRQMHSKLPLCGQVFFVMPLMHAEDEGLQEQCLTSLEVIQAHAPQPLAHHVDGTLKSARQHLQIIQTFGRFPHRNRALGRDSTAQELRFLEASSGFGQ